MIIHFQPNKTTSFSISYNYAGRQILEKEQKLFNVLHVVCIVYIHVYM